MVSRSRFGKVFRRAWKSLRSLLSRPPGGTGAFDLAKASEIADFLRQAFGYYTTANLKTVAPKEFRQHILSSLDTVDFAAEGYSPDELARQRDLSVKFHWGHNHDFGDFKVTGRMGDRHLRLFTDFASLFPLDSEDFRSREIFDVGCWTGGTTLLLAALGARVFAIEEVKKYAEMAGYLVAAFGLEEQVSVEHRSVYSCNSDRFCDRFDIVFFAGVIYHLSDPLIALRILFNSLKLGGTILIESAGLNRPDPVCGFEGSLVHHSGEKARLNRGGWNWFLPSPSALARMMREAGFEDVESLWHTPAGRVYARGEKLSRQGICKAGLSVPDIK